jgi:hypothetical protein
MTPAFVLASQAQNRLYIRAPWLGESLDWWIPQASVTVRATENAGVAKWQ